MAAIRAVSFDAVGTFLHFVEPVAVSYARFGRKHGLDGDAQILAQSLRYAFAEAPPMAAPVDADVEAYEYDWWRLVAARAFARAPSDSRFADCFEDLFHYFGDVAAWSMMPSFPRLLAGLRRQGLRLAVCSNFDGRLYALLDAFGVSHYLDAVVLPRDAGCQKPAAGMFVLTARRLGVSRHTLLHVGDDADEDVAAATSAGLQAIRLVFAAGKAAAAYRALALRLRQKTV